MRMRRALFPLFLVLSSGCSYVPHIPGVTPYRIEIQQGNFISPDMLAQLKPGMSKEQVRLVLGTPLLTDIFHAERHTTASNFSIETNIACFTPSMVY